MGRYKFDNDGKILQLYDNDKDVLITPIDLDGVELILNLQDEMIKSYEKKLEDKLNEKSRLQEVQNQISGLEEDDGGNNS